MSSEQRYLEAGGGEQLGALFPSLCQFPSLSHSHLLSLLHFFWPFLWLSACYSLSPSLSLSPPTVLRALSMSMPWLQGTAGLARQSPALPRRETSTRWRRRYLNASAITRMASWVSAEVYCSKQKTAEHSETGSRGERQKIELLF